MVQSKIKLLAAVAAMAVTGIQTLNAQQLNDDVTLNVTLVAVQNISVNSGQTTVTITFNESSDYLNGVSSPQLAHLEVSSTDDFVVKVSTASDLSDGSNTIPVNTITVTPVYASGTDPGATATAVALSTTATTILSSTNGTTKALYDVTYDASGGSDYVNKPAGTYSTMVTYTISPS